MSFATVVEMSILLISKVSFIMTITVGKLFIHRVFPVSPVCFCDSEGRIWVGGYNVFGRIERDGRGCITLRTLLSDLDTDSLGELEDMAEIDKRIYLKSYIRKILYGSVRFHFDTGSGTSGPIAGKVEKSILSLNESGVFYPEEKQSR